MSRLTALEKKLANTTGLGLDIILIAIAIVLIIAAFCIKNKWLKAAIIAYEVLP